MTGLSMRKSAAAAGCGKCAHALRDRTAATSKFFDDDPMWVERDTQDASE